MHAHKCATHTPSRRLKSTNRDLGKSTSLLAGLLLIATIASVAPAQVQAYEFPPITAQGIIEYSISSIPKITISGTDFIASGEPYMFRGVNVQFTGLHHPESGCQSISSSTFDTYESWHVNLMRVWLNMEMASPQYGVWDQDFFDDLKQVVDLAEEHRIYLLISGLHQYNLGPALGGTGFPNWMFTGISTQNAGWDRLYKSVVQEDPAYPEIRDAIREYYHRVCNICKDRNIVMGYDIFNEPEYRDVPGYSKISASYFYEKLSAYITEIDGAKPQCVENNFIDNNYEPQIPNLFVSPHGYAGHTHDYSLSQMKDYFTHSDYWVQGPNWNVPTMNAEWFLGTQSEAQNYGLSSSDIAQWYDTYMRGMEELGISWAVLRCEASPSNLHWVGSPVRDALYLYWDLNTFPS